MRDALNKELEKVSGRIDALEGSEDSYFERSADQVLYGNYSDDVTLLGTAGQIGLGLTGLDFAGDIRDLTYDITHWDGSLAHAGQTLLDVVGLIPGIGALKNADEVAALLKQALKAAPALTDGAKYALKNVDVIAAGITSLFKNSDELGEIGKAAGKSAEDLAREYAETARLMKNADKADEAAPVVSGAGKTAASEASELDELYKKLDDAWDEGSKAGKGAGDYATLAEKARNVDVSTSAHQAVFYSGEGNRVQAEAFAKLNGKTTLEMTPGGKYFDELNLFGKDSPLTKPQAREIWSILSERYAKAASGNVYGFVKGSYPESIFNAVEYQALQENPYITNIFTELFN